MKSSNTSKRLNEYMNKHNLKQVDILKMAEPYCKKHGVKLNKSDISQYVSGKVEPGQDKLFVLARALKVTEAWLMGYDEPEHTSVFDIKNVIPLPKTKKIPLLGAIACGEPITAVENIEDYVGTPENINADFCLRCKGDSMITARIFDGDIVYIRQQPDVENGEIAAVLIDGEATLKRVFKHKDSLELRAENPTFSPMYYEGAELNEIRILGKAVAFLSAVK